ncbi:MAG: NAD(+) synthase [Muribaculaceae bacterium]|nr:NAD(+) synthase [Muribaculaceae bacterium]
MNHNGYLRVAAAVPPVTLADCRANAQGIVDMLAELDRQGVRLAVMPELCVTGYSCGDLFHNALLLDEAAQALGEIAAATAGRGVTLIVGVPLVKDDALYNCAVAVGGGKVLMAVPKSYLPNYNEFYEKRLFTSGHGVIDSVIWEDEIPFGTDCLLEVDGVRVGLEICEDLWTPLPPSTDAALAGAQVICNLSASDDIIGKYAYLKSLVAQQSARCMAAYLYASAGFGESSTDLVFTGKALIAENGALLRESDRWKLDPHFVVADIDVAALDRDRLHIGSFTDCRRAEGLPPYRVVRSGASKAVAGSGALLRWVNPHPFVPRADAAVDARCEEIVNIQVLGLARRLAATGCRSLTIGISGGLDSTLALLVAVRTFDLMHLSRTGIVAVTMPGFGTTGRTYRNAMELMHGLGVTVREIPIAAAVRQHFSDIGHDADVHDVTYENSQARERTQILMDIANQTGGMVLGTGDLSELALGWATYNGDHMSMYGVNASVPKTLVRFLVRHFAAKTDSEQVRASLTDIIDTPISPELIPADEKGEIAQKTEDLVGPYELHDFFLYYMLRYGFAPDRVFSLALQAFCEPGRSANLAQAPECAEADRAMPVGEYDRATVLKWLRTFYRRFFSQQFKRSCLPDGPKVGSVCLSPRGDWRMPSDAAAAAWLRAVDML